MLRYSRVTNKCAGDDKHAGWKISKIDKHAGGNKALQVGNFQKSNNLCSTFIRYTRVVHNSI